MEKQIEKNSKYTYSHLEQSSVEELIDLKVYSDEKIKEKKKAQKYYIINSKKIECFINGKESRIKAPYIEGYITITNKLLRTLSKEQLIATKKYFDEQLGYIKEDKVFYKKFSKDIKNFLEI